MHYTLTKSVNDLNIIIKREKNKKKNVPKTQGEMFSQVSLDQKGDTRG